MTKKIYMYTSEGTTDIGRVRSTNQDSILVDDSTGLYIVADGMGGHAGGEVASQLAIENIAAFLGEHEAAFSKMHRLSQACIALSEASGPLTLTGSGNTPIADACEDGAPSNKEKAAQTPADNSLKETQNKSEGSYKHPILELRTLLSRAINHASARIYDKALEDPTLKGMGTTVTLLKIVGSHAYIAHVGDSRTYLIRQGFIYQITLDHSLVSEQVRAGIITEEEAELHYLRNMITRSVGYQEEEYVDTFVFSFEKNDKIIICSDGLHGKLTDSEIAMAADQQGSSVTSHMINKANEQGGEDNISVIIICAQDSCETGR